MQIFESWKVWIALVVHMFRIACSKRNWTAIYAESISSYDTVAISHPSATRRQRISSLSPVLDRTVFSFAVTRTAGNITIAIATERNKLRRCLREWRKMHLRSLLSVIRNSGYKLMLRDDVHSPLRTKVTQIFVAFIAPPRNAANPNWILVS